MSDCNPVLKCPHCGQASTPSMESMRKELLEMVGFAEHRGYEYPRGTFTRAELAALYNYMKLHVKKEAS